MSKAEAGAGAGNYYIDINESRLTHFLLKQTQYIMSFSSFFFFYGTHFGLGEYFIRQKFIVKNKGGLPVDGKKKIYG